MHHTPSPNASATSGPEVVGNVFALRPYSSAMTLAFLLQAVPDTVVTVPARDIHDVLQSATFGLAIAVLLVLLLLVGYLTLMVRRASLAVSSLRERISLDPAVASLRAAASNLQEISASLRDEASKVSASAGRLSERLNQASDRIEERIEDFNALIEVMQGEAEGAFVESASTARGVRAGVGALRRGDGQDHPLAGGPDDSGED